MLLSEGYFSIVLHATVLHFAPLKFTCVLSSFFESVLRNLSFHVASFIVKSKVFTDHLVSNKPPPSPHVAL